MKIFRFKRSKTIGHFIDVEMRTPELLQRNNGIDFLTTFKQTFVKLKVKKMFPVLRSFYLNDSKETS